VSGTFEIFKCEWNLADINEDLVHFELAGGRFYCNDVVINQFNKSWLKFLNCTENNSLIECINVRYKNCVTDLTNTHFNLYCVASFTDSVYFILFLFFFNLFFFFFFFLRYLKTLKESLSRRIVQMNVCWLSQIVVSRIVLQLTLEAYFF
jgi:hypothetical protein